MVNFINKLLNKWLGKRTIHFDYFVDGVEVKGKHRIYQVVEKVGGPKMKVTQNNANAYLYLGEGDFKPSGSWSFSINGYHVVRTPKTRKV